MENPAASIAPDAAPVLQEKENKWKLPIIIGIIAVLIIVMIVGMIMFLTADPARTANIRDIVIILFAFVNVLIGALLVVLVFQLQLLIGFLRNELKPMMSDAQQMVQTVRGTTTFVSDSVAKPAIEIASFFARVRGMRDAVRNKTNKSK